MQASERILEARCINTIREERRTVIGRMRLLIGVIDIIMGAVLLLLLLLMLLLLLLDIHCMRGDREGQRDEDGTRADNETPIELSLAGQLG